MPHGWWEPLKTHGFSENALVAEWRPEEAESCHRSLTNACTEGPITAEAGTFLKGSEVASRFLPCRGHL